MNNLDPSIRNAVRAVILDGDRILLQQKCYEDGTRRVALPGGGQEVQETLAEALRRECLEEIGAEVRVGELVHLADWFKPRPTEPPTTRHLVEFLFRCELPAGYQPHNGHHPDRHQVGVAWVPLASLDDTLLVPPGLATVLRGIAAGVGPIHPGTL